MCVVLPLAIHIIPNGGSILLPMHIPVLLCGLVCGWPYGFICGLLGPFLSSFTGMPPLAVLPGMMVECGVYGMTSGLGKIYPAAFLDLVSYADSIGEFVPGITPYGNTFGIGGNAVKMVYGNNAVKLPIWRRNIDLEFLSVPSSEYSVWETIAPAAAAAGYLIEKAELPPESLKKRKPVDDFRKLAGYSALP
jgi:hypothetical protein